MERDGVSAQLRRGALEHCVLALLEDRELYGFELVRLLAETDGLVTSEGTIYPLLSRLRKEGYVATTWQDSDSGPPRKYYTITDLGRESLAAFKIEWRRFTAAVDDLLGEGARR